MACGVKVISGNFCKNFEFLEDLSTLYFALGRVELALKWGSRVGQSRVIHIPYSMYIL